MRTWTPLLAGILLAVAPGEAAFAQPPSVEVLQGEIERLRTEMTTQREEFELRIAELQAQMDTGLRETLQAQIDDIVAKKSKFYRRPDSRGRFWGEYNVFDAVQGGLIFTGLFRSRFEYRANNVDFNPEDDGGLDDEGVRLNGRFRLGFGAVLLRSSVEEPVISALMEFQSVGTFANNTYFTFAGPGGVPLPTEFTIFREPYEQVNLYQGYLDFQRLPFQDVFIKVGRQELVFGNEFVLGNNAFYDGTVHDALLVEYENDSFRVSTFFAKEAQSDTDLAVVFPASDFDEDHFMGVYTRFDPADDIDIEAYALYFDARSNFTDSFVTRSTNFGFDGALNPALSGHFWTLGARGFLGNMPLFDGFLALNAEVAYQTGNNGITAGIPGAPDDQEIQGWAAEFIANYWFNPALEGVKPMVTLAYYYAGGGEANDVTPNGFPLSTIGFQPLFINRHFNVRERYRYDQPYMPGGGRYGNLDLIPLNNVHIIKAVVSIEPTVDVELGLGGLMAITADDEGYGTGVFGYELDLFGSYQYSDYIEFAANFSIFFPQKTAEDASAYYFFTGSGLDGAPDDQPAIGFYLQALIEF